MPAPIIPKGKEIFPIPKWYQCSHRHLSGRRCKSTVMKQGTRCKACLPINSSEDYCPECYSMAKAFGVTL